MTWFPSPADILSLYLADPYPGHRIISSHLISFHAPNAALHPSHVTLSVSVSVSSTRQTRVYNVVISLGCGLDVAPPTPPLPYLSVCISVSTRVCMRLVAAAAANAAPQHGTPIYCMHHYLYHCTRASKIPTPYPAIYCVCLFPTEPSVSSTD